MVVGLVLREEAFFKDRAGRSVPALGRDFGLPCRQREPRFAPRHGTRATPRAKYASHSLGWGPLPARAMTAAEVVSSNQTSPPGVKNLSDWSTKGELEDELLVEKKLLETD
jgi:hypothetical protein